MLTLTVAICPACIPLWVAIVLACLPFLRPILEELGLDHYLKNTIVRWMPAFLVPALIGVAAWWFLSDAQEPTPSTNTITQEPTETCHCQSSAAEKTGTQSREEPTDILYALASDTRSELSYCYTLDLRTKEQSVTEVSYDLSSTRILNFYLDDERESIYAVTDNGDGLRAVYFIDPEHTAFHWIAPPTEHNMKGLHAEEESIQETHLLKTLFPEHWNLLGILTTTALSQTTYASIFDTQQETYLLVSIEEEGKTITTVMEADLPIHAVGILRQ